MPVGAVLPDAVMQPGQAGRLASRGAAKPAGSLRPARPQAGAVADCRSLWCPACRPHP